MLLKKRAECYLQHRLNTERTAELEGIYEKTLSRMLYRITK